LPQQRTIYTTLAALPRVVAHALDGPAVMLLGEQFRARTRENARDWAPSAEISDCVASAGRR